MARHKQCQKLRGSRYADLTTPEGVTPIIEIKQIPSNLSPKGGRVGKLNKFVTKCTRLIKTLITIIANNGLNFCDTAFKARQCL